MILQNIKTVDKLSGKFKMEQQLRELASDVFDVGAVKFGEFITKVGLKTPVYVDLRILIAHPKILVSVNRIK